MMSKLPSSGSWERKAVSLALPDSTDSPNIGGTFTVGERCPGPRQATYWEESHQSLCTNWWKHLTVSPNNWLLTTIFSSRCTQALLSQVGPASLLIWRQLQVNWQFLCELTLCLHHQQSKGGRKNVHSNSSMGSASEISWALWQDSNRQTWNRTQNCIFGLKSGTGNGPDS